MKTKKISTNELVLVGMFTAVLAVLSQIAVPMPSGVPVTLQTFAVALCASVLGGKLGAASVLIYLCLGMAGVPVFAGFSAGVGAVFGATGGFLIGFLFLALLTGCCDPARDKVKAVICPMIGLAVCHLLGILQFMFLMKVGFAEAALLVSVPYLLKDVFSVAAAFAVRAPMKKALRASMSGLER